MLSHKSLSLLYTMFLHLENFSILWQVHESCCNFCCPQSAPFYFSIIQIHQYLEYSWSISRVHAYFLASLIFCHHHNALQYSIVSILHQDLVHFLFLKGLLHCLVKAQKSALTKMHTMFRHPHIALYLESFWFFHHMHEPLPRFIWLSSLQFRPTDRLMTHSHFLEMFFTLLITQYLADFCFHRRFVVRNSSQLSSPYIRLMHPHT